MWCWRRLLRVPWTLRRHIQSILKEISPEYSLKGLMLKLKLQYFGHLMWRTDSLEKTLMLGKIEGRKRRDNKGWDGWIASSTRGTWVWASFGSRWWTGKPGVLQSMGSQTAGHNWATKLNWCYSSHMLARSWVVGDSGLPFPMSQFFTLGGQSIWASASASVLPMDIQGWFPLGLTGLISLQSKGHSRVFSNTTVQKYVT